MDTHLDNTKRGDVPDPFVRWGEALLREPRAAVADILSGRGARSAQQRAESEDFFADLLAHSQWQEQGAVLADKLDSALWQWLTDRMQWLLARISEQGARAYAAELSDALAVAARLPLTRTARGLIADQPHWDNRLSGLRWPGDIDLLRQLDMVLIQHQLDTRFVPRWFAACERAAWGSPYWRTDLTTGLLGLRKLPHAPGTQPERSVASALARFAALAPDRGLPLQEAEKAFRRTAATLTVLYPRQDEYWQRLWTEVLDDLPNASRSAVKQLGGEWIEGILSSGTGDKRSRPRSKQKGKQTGEGKKGKGHPRYTDLPVKEELDRLLADIKQTGRIRPPLWTRVRGLMRRHWAYAETTGESRFAVLSLHKLGVRILRLNPGKALLAELHRWTRQALEMDPENPFIWGLWAKVLSALGETESALAVRWETIRRFPGNAVSRNELAEVLRKNNRPVLAEQLLRQTRRDFPRDEVCRNALAELLRETNRLKEAEELLRQTMRDFPRNEVCRNALAELLRETNCLKEAEELLRQTMRDFPRNEVCRNALAELLRGTNRLEKAEELLRQTMRDFPRNEVCRNILALMLWQQQRRREAEAVLAEAEALTPNNPYVLRLGRWMRGEEESPPEYDAEHVLPMRFYLQAHLDSEGIDADSTTGDDLEPRGFGDATETESAKIGEDQDGDQVSEQARRESEPVGMESSDGTQGPGESLGELEPESEPGAVSSPMGPEPTTQAFLSYLVQQMFLMELYFGALTAPEDGKTVADLTADLEAGKSDLVLVAAHRAGLLEGPEGRERLKLWIRVRPSSYSANLLLAWHGDNGDGPSRTAMENIARRFPEHRP